jgi:beta-N-acetylhexosaminidase
VVTASAEELEADLSPFSKLAGRARIGMTAHIVYSAYDAEAPATLSAKVIGEVIRGRIGFEGLLLSDDLEMAALTGSLGERAQRALTAGCDLVLHGSGVLAEGQEVAGALGPIGEAASARLAAALLPSVAEVPEIGALLAKRDALLAFSDSSSSARAGGAGAG